MNMPGSGSHDQEKSKYRGVGKKSYGNWTAKIQHNSKQIWLGTYCREEMAAVAFDVAAYHFRGREAKLNFPCLINHLPNSLPPDFTVEHVQTAVEALHTIISSNVVAPVNDESSISGLKPMDWDWEGGMKAIDEYPW